MSDVKILSERKARRTTTAILEMAAFKTRNAVHGTLLFPEGIFVIIAKHWPANKTKAHQPIQQELRFLPTLRVLKNLGASVAHFSLSAILNRMYVKLATDNFYGFKQVHINSLVLLNASCRIFGWIPISSNHNYNKVAEVVLPYTCARFRLVFAQKIFLMMWQLLCE